MGLRSDHASGNLAVEVQFHRVDSDSGVGPFVLVYEMAVFEDSWLVAVGVIVLHPGVT